MTRCLEFYRKWEELPNFCEKAERTAQEIEVYLEVVKELEKLGVSKERSIERLSEGASRPLHGLEDPPRGKVLALVAGAIKRDQDVSAADIRVWVAMAEGKEPAAKEPRAGKGAESSPTAPAAAPAPSAPPTFFTRGLPGTPSAVVETTQKTGPEPAVPLRLGSANIQVTREDADVLTWLVKTGRARDPLDAAQRVFDEGIDRIRDHMDGEESRERDAREGK